MTCDGYTLDFSPLTYRKLLAQAARECDVQSYWVLLKNGADPLLRVPLPEPDPEDRYAYWDDYDDWDRSYPPFHPTEEDTILFIAAKSGCAQIVEHLLGLGEDPNHRGASRETALQAWVRGSQSAADDCHWERVGELLLEAGCDPQADQGFVWRHASQKPDGKAKRILLGWKASKRRQRLDQATMAAQGEAAQDLPVSTTRGRL